MAKQISMTRDPIIYTSLKADHHQEVKGGFTFSRCLDGIS